MRAPFQCGISGQTWRSLPLSLHLRESFLRWVWESDPSMLRTHLFTVTSVGSPFLAHLSAQALNENVLNGCLIQKESKRKLCSLTYIFWCLCPCEVEMDKGSRKWNKSADCLSASVRSHLFLDIFWWGQKIIWFYASGFFFSYFMFPHQDLDVLNLFTFYHAYER